LALLLVLLAAGLSANVKATGNFEYSVADGQAIIIGYDGEGGELSGHPRSTGRP
jgi:hypothetical protein